MSPILLQKRERKPSLNTEFGLHYRHIAIRRESLDRLKGLKEETGLPITELASRAIDYFIANVKVSSDVHQR